jgi:hypothetical protein
MGGSDQESLLGDRAARTTRKSFCFFFQKEAIASFS